MFTTAEPECSKLQLSLERCSKILIICLKEKLKTSPTTDFTVLTTQISQTGLHRLFQLISGLVLRMLPTFSLSTTRQLMAPAMSKCSTTEHQLWWRAVWSKCAQFQDSSLTWETNCTTVTYKKHAQKHHRLSLLEWSCIRRKMKSSSASE